MSFEVKLSATSSDISHAAHSIALIHMFAPSPHAEHAVVLQTLRLRPEVQSCHDHHHMTHLLMFMQGRSTCTRVAAMLPAAETTKRDESAHMACGQS